MNNEENITQFETKRMFIWLFPIFVVLVGWCWSRYLPSEQMMLYAVQAIFLSMYPYFLLVFPVYTIVLWKNRWRWRSLISLVLWLGIGSPPESAGKGLSVVVANVNAFVPEIHQFEQDISDLKSPYFVQIERRTNTISSMKRAAFDGKNIGLRRSHYTDVFCQNECEAYVTDQIGSSTMAMPVALLRPKDKVCVVAIHAPPPLPVDASGMKPYIEYLEQHIQDGRVVENWFVCNKGDGVLMMGDANAVPGSAPYQRLVNLGLHDVQSDIGIWGSTWPMKDFYLPIPIFRLDHILVGDVEIRGWRQIPIDGSDHKGLQVWL